MENSIYNLDKGRWDKEAPMKVAETRLFNRHARPNVEMCRDETSHRYEFLINQILFLMFKEYISSTIYKVSITFFILDF